MSLIYLAPILDEVSEEADRARRKFGDQTHLTDPEWLAVLAEEFGEAAMDVTKRCVPPVGDNAPSLPDLRAEVLQVAAVAARWIMAIDDRGFDR